MPVLTGAFPYIASPAVNTLLPLPDPGLHNDLGSGQPLPRGNPSIDKNDFSGNITSARRTQKQYTVGNVLRFSQSVQGDETGKFLPEFSGI
jgi:hypothetical protein